MNLQKLLNVTVSAIESWIDVQEKEVTISDIMESFGLTEFDIAYLEQGGGLDTSKMLPF